MPRLHLGITYALLFERWHIGQRGKTRLHSAICLLIPENRDRQVREMRELIASPRVGNRVFVSHEATIAALTGISLDTAEMVVVTPQGGGQFVVNGRFSVRAQ